LITNTFWSVVYDAIFLLSSLLPAATNNFPKCVELSVKISCCCFQF
jgi:hypothetical protein